MKYLTLANGMKTKVDTEDFKKLNEYRWYFDGVRYALRHEKVLGRTKSIGMARQIMNAPKGMVVDHINGDCLDNRKSNLRVCTHIQNMQNQATPKRNTSGFKGVSWAKHMNKYRARIRVNTKLIHLGYFSQLEEAVKVYREAAKNYFGEYYREA